MVYPHPTQPTFVVGEPLFLSLKLENASQRAVFVPRSPGTAMQDMVVQRLDPACCVANLSPPLLYCYPSRPDRWLRIAPGSSATFQETLLFRGGELVFPREGTYQLAARLRLRNRWLSSDAVTVRIAPPLEKRHERSSDLAADPESGLFVELGGSLSVPARDRLTKLRRDNPKFPLNPLVQLLDARNRVLAEAATPQKDRQRLQQLADDACLPPALRAEAQLPLLLDRAQAGDSQAKKRLRQRLAKRDRLPIAPHAAHLIRRNLTQL